MPAFAQNVANMVEPATNEAVPGVGTGQHEGEHADPTSRRPGDRPRR